MRAASESHVTPIWQISVLVVRIFSNQWEQPSDSHVTPIWPISVQVVRIFTSSTFTDMLMERNTLMEYVYPKIKGQNIAGSILK